MAELSNTNTFKKPKLTHVVLDPEKFPLSAVNPELWEARVDLAGVYRMCHNARFNEGVCNHLTVMAPGHDDKFLVIAYGLMWSEVTATNLLLVDKAGHVLEGEGKPEHTAFFIHSELHMADPKNNICILHTHQPYASAICCLEGGKLEMVHQNCLRFYNDIAYDREFNGLVLEQNEGKRIASQMGGKRVLFHSNHGVITVGKSVAQAWDDLYYLERACEVYVLACSTGRPLMHISDETADAFKKDLDSGGEHWAKMFFEAAKRDLIKQGRDADFCT